MAIDLKALAALKESFNLSVKSEHASVPTPLATFLIIYSKANKDCYDTYMEGAKSLISFLTPIDLTASNIPAITDPNCLVPRLLSGYESDELARLLAPQLPRESMDDYMPRLELAKRAILFTMFNEVFKELY